jgi:hypothetical protein
MFLNGFYRSWISRPIREDRSKYLYDDIDVNEIFLDKFIRASLTGILHSTWYCPISIYQSIGRLEIKLTGKDPQKYKFLYTEPFSYITLPQEDAKITPDVSFK